LQFGLRTVGCVLKDPAGVGLHMHGVLVHVPNKRALLLVRRRLISLDDAGSPRGLYDVALVAHLMLMMIALVYN
jgi:hypothetical protein